MYHVNIERNQIIYNTWVKRKNIKLKIIAFIFGIAKIVAAQLQIKVALILNLKQNDKLAARIKGIKWDSQ